SFSTPVLRPPLSARPSRISTSSLTASAQDLPRRQKPIIGIGSLEAIARLARKSERRNSIGPSSPSLKAVTLLFALKNLFRMLEGIRRYEKGIRVKRRNLQFGFSSIRPYISR